MKVWVCENEDCGWEGKKPASLGIPGLKVKVCQKCLSRKIHQEERKNTPENITLTKGA